MAKGKNYLKGRFETGDVPSQSDFEDLIDSAVNLAEDVDGTIPDSPEAGHVPTSGAVKSYVAAEVAKLPSKAEVTQLSSKVVYFQGEGCTTEIDVTNTIKSIIDDGYFWNIETDVAVKTSYTSYHCAEYSLNGVTSVHCVGKNANSSKQRFVVFVNDSYDVIDKYPSASGTQLIDATIQVPQGSTKMLLTMNYSGTDPSASFDFSIVVTKESTGSTIYVKEKLQEVNGRLVSVEGIIDKLRGKKVAILGDSISTNGDYSASNKYGNIPEIIIGTDDVGVQLSAYITKADVDGLLSVGGHTFTADEIGTEVQFTPTSSDVGKVVGKPKSYNNASRKVWWEWMQDVLGINPIPVCWSGSSITSHESSSNNFKSSYAWHESQIRKCGIRTNGSMGRTAPDAIIVYRGTNDFSHTPYAKLNGNLFGGVSFGYPNDDSFDGGFGFKEGLVLTIKKLRSAYPNAKIFLCTLNVFKRVNWGSFPTDNGLSTLPQYNNAIREVADYMGCGLIELDKCGITFENCYTEGYVTDASDTFVSASTAGPTHPSDKGHKVIGMKAIADMLSQWSNME